MDIRKYIGEGFRGLSRKMLISFGGLFLSIIFIMGILINIKTESFIVDRFESELKDTNEILFNMTSTAVKSTVKGHLTAIAERNKDLVKYYYTQNALGRMSKQEALAALRTLFLDPDYSRIGKTGYLIITDGSGKVLIHPNLPAGTDVSGQDFMKKALELKNGYLEYKWKNPGESEEKQKAAVISYFPQWDMMIWASSNITEFSSLLNLDELRASILSVKFGESGYPYVIDTNGVLIIHPEFEGKNISNSRDPDGKYPIREIITRKTGRIEYYWKNPQDPKPRKKVVYYRYLPLLGWIVASGGYLDELSSHLYIMRYIIIATIIISFIITIIIASALVKRLLIPFHEIKQFSSRISEGDLTGEVTVVSDDEIGDISQQFNLIVKNFRQIVIKIKETTDVLTKSIQDLSVSAREISTTSNQQAASVKEIVSTMEDSDSLSKKVAIRIDEVAGIANETKNFVERGFSLIKETLVKMNEIRNTNSETITEVRDLDAKIESIGEVVNIINSIADQTKIIAFNAELEASSAGEAGKNFQIVASEVRRLADITVESTREIKDKIDEIQKSSDNLIVASEKGTERIKEGLDFSNKLRLVFDEILKSSEISANSSEQIVESVNQQVSAFEQILITLKQISEGIDDFVISTKSTTSASESLKEIGSELTSIVSRYRA